MFCDLLSSLFFLRFPLFSLDFTFVVNFECPSLSDGAQSVLFSSKSCDGLPVTEKETYEKKEK